MKILKFIGKLIVYLLGLFIIALGINVSKMAALGISPVSSIPGVMDAIFNGTTIKIGSLTITITLGVMVIALYVLLVLAQLVVLGKKFRAINALGVVVGFVFGYMVDIVGIDQKAIGHLLYGFSQSYAPQTFVMKLVFLAASIVIIGIGVYVYLKPNLVPMPGEGLAQAISTKTGKAFGNCKTIVDTSLIIIAIVVQIIFLGGFASLNPFSDVRGVAGIGTIVSALLVGQVVKLLKKIFK